MTQQNGEIRVVSMEDFEVRLAGDGEGPLIKGFPAVFNSLSEDLGGWRELIAPGAFKKSLKENRDIFALANHDTAKPLASVRHGSLTLWEEERGLGAEARPTDTTYTADLLTNIKERLLPGASFAFRTIKDQWEKVKDFDRRTLLEVNLIEVSFGVPFPAFKRAKMEARSASGGGDGIDLEALDYLLARTQRGLALTAADDDLVNGWIQILQAIQPEPVESHSGPEAGEDGEPTGSHSTLALRERELALAEIG